MFLNKGEVYAMTKREYNRITKIAENELKMIFQQIDIEPKINSGRASIAWGIYMYWYKITSDKQQEGDNERMLKILTTVKKES